MKQTADKPAIQTRFSAAEYEQVKKAAKRRGCSVAALVRLSLAQSGFVVLGDDTVGSEMEHESSEGS